MHNASLLRFFRVPSFHYGNYKNESKCNIVSNRDRKVWYKTVRQRLDLSGMKLRWPLNEWPRLVSLPMFSCFWRWKFSFSLFPVGFCNFPFSIVVIFIVCLHRMLWCGVQTVGIEFRCHRQVNSFKTHWVEFVARSWYGSKAVERLKNDWELVVLRLDDHKNLSFSRYQC